MEQVEFYTALASGVSGIVIAIISLYKVKVQKQLTHDNFSKQEATNEKLKKDVDTFKSKLKIAREKKIKVFELTIKDLALYSSNLSDVILKLGNYNNAAKNQNFEDEYKNNCQFYIALDKIRFPGIFVPKSMTQELIDLRSEFELLKQRINKAGYKDQLQADSQEFQDIDKFLIELEFKGSEIVQKWREILIKSNDVSTAISS